MAEVFLRVLFLLLAFAGTANAEDNEADDSSPPKFLLACDPNSQGTVRASTVVLYFQNASACQCTVYSENDYDITPVWAYPDDIAVFINESACSSGKDELRGVDTTCKVSESETVTVSTEASADDIPKVAVVVKGKGDVNVTCPKITITSTPATTTNTSSTTTSEPSPTSPLQTTGERDEHSTTSSTIKNDASTSSPAMTPSSTVSDNKTESTINVTVTSPASAEQTTETASNIPEAGTKGAESNGHGKLPNGPERRQENEKKKPTESQGQQEDISMMSWVVVAVGSLLILLAFVAFAFVAAYYRKRKRSKGRQAGKDKRKKEDNNYGHAPGRGGGKKSKLDSSRDSLIERHNYEEVSEDGASGASGISIARVPPSKSPPSVPENNYSRINATGHARQASGASANSVSNVTERPGIPDGSEDDDYNKLDLHATARANAKPANQTKKPPQPEDDDYMEIGNDDIYEAVDDQGTPLCQRKGKRARREEEYTDCVSSEDLERGDGASGNAQVVFMPKSKQNRPGGVAKPSTPENGKRPDLPLTSPPVYNRLHSKSAENLTSDKEPKPPRSSGKHKYSKSEDLKKMQGEYRSDPFQAPGSNSKLADSYQSMPLVNGHEEDVYEINEFEDTRKFKKQNGQRANSSKKNRQQNQNQANNSKGLKQGNRSKSYENIPNGAGEAELRKKPSGNPRIFCEDQHQEDPDNNQDQVVMRPKSRARPKSQGPTLVDHLLETNASLLAFQEAVRSSMEINEEEMVMIDNIVYGTLPRDSSAPTTEL